MRHAFFIAAMLMAAASCSDGVETESDTIPDEADPEVSTRSSTMDPRQTLGVGFYRLCGLQLAAREAPYSRTNFANALRDLTDCWH